MSCSGGEGSMGKRDKALRVGGGVSGIALRNDFFNVGSSSCQYLTDVFWYISKYFNDKTNIIGGLC